jgi:hypothetical protein
MTLDPQTYREFLNTLYEELIEAKNLVMADGRQFSRRSFVRIFYSVVEGCVSMLKTQTLDVAEVEKWPLTDAERAMLKEETYSLSEKGKPFVQTKFIPTDANLRFTLELFLRPAFPNFKVDTGGRGWAAFKAGLDVRHRITHPKMGKSFIITDDEIRLLFEAVDWFHETFMGEQIKAHISVAQKALSELPQPLDPTQ